MMKKGLLRMRAFATTGLIVLAFYNVAKAQTQPQTAVSVAAPAITPATAAALAAPVPAQSATLAQPQVQLAPKNPNAPIVLPPMRSKFRQTLDRWYFLMTGRRSDDPDPP